MTESAPFPMPLIIDAMDDRTTCPGVPHLIWDWERIGGINRQMVLWCDGREVDTQHALYAPNP